MCGLDLMCVRFVHIQYIANCLLFGIVMSGVVCLYYREFDAFKPCLY